MTTWRGLREQLSAADGSLDVVDIATAAVTRAIPADVWCGVIVDPATLLDTGGQHRDGFPAEVMPRLFELEHIDQEGAECLRALAQRPGTVSVLSASGDIGASVYYRDILRPLGLADEMRIVLRHGPHVWGLLVLCRAGRGFSPAEVRAADGASGPITEALRRSMLLTGSDSGTVADAPGLLMLDDHHGEISASPTARAWLDELQETPKSMPYAVRAVAAAARSDAPARSRVRTRSGRWAALHAWRMPSATAIAIGPADPGELAALVLDAYALTTREREVTQLVLLGRSTAQIGVALGVSEYTVQDHLKAVFAKTGVRSRRDLIGAIFTSHYLPQLAAPRLTTDGRVSASA